jgi:hypothetical protein
MCISTDTVWGNAGVTASALGLWCNSEKNCGRDFRYGKVVVGWPNRGDSQAKIGSAYAATSASRPYRMLRAARRSLVSTRSFAKPAHSRADVGHLAEPAAACAELTRPLKIGQTARLPAAVGSAKALV